MIRIKDEAIILSVAKFQESFLLVRCLTKDHGMMAGLIRRSKKNNEIVPGNYVSLHWSARLREQLGYFKFEVLQNIFALLITIRHKVILLNSATSILPILINEREQQLETFGLLRSFIFNISKSLSIDYNEIVKDFFLYVTFETEVLNRSGYGKVKHSVSKYIETADLLRRLKISENFMQSHFLSSKKIKIPMSRKFLVDYLSNLQD